MRLTSFTDYSLRVLLHVATAPEGRATIAGIAAAYGISEHHLVKVVHLLGREGFLVNSRGRGGGLRLAADPAAIRVGAVVRATEGAEGPVECFSPERDQCAISGRCALAGALSKAMAAFYETLDAYTLADLLQGKRAARIAAILHRAA